MLTWRPTSRHHSVVSCKSQLSTSKLNMFIVYSKNTYSYCLMLELLSLFQSSSSGKPFSRLSCFFSWLFFPATPSRNVTGTVPNLVHAWTWYILYRCGAWSFWSFFPWGSIPSLASLFSQLLTHAAASHQTLYQLSVKSCTKSLLRSTHAESPTFSLFRNIPLLTEGSAFASQNIPLVKSFCILSHFPLGPI